MNILIEQMPDGHHRIHSGGENEQPVGCTVDFQTAVVNRPPEVYAEQKRQWTMGEIRDFCQDCFPTAERVPPALVGHLQHLRDFVAAPNPTDAEVIHVLKDVIRAIHALNWRIENDD
jgi:hypothetical protein